MPQLSCLKLLTLELSRRANSRPRSPGPAPIPRQPRRLIGCAGGSIRRFHRVGCRLPCLTHFFVRHLVPLCLGPRVRTLGLGLLGAQVEASGGFIGLVAGGLPCLTHFFVRHLVPLCMGPRVRTLGL